MAHLLNHAVGSREPLCGASPIKPPLVGLTAAHIFFSFASCAHSPQPHSHLCSNLGVEIHEFVRAAVSKLMNEDKPYDVNHGCGLLCRFCLSVCGGDDHDGLGHRQCEWLLIRSSPLMSDGWHSESFVLLSCRFALN